MRHVSDKPVVIYCRSKVLKMSYVFASAVLLFAGTCYASPTTSIRIVGGVTTTIENYPSIVQVDRLRSDAVTWGQTCAGNILNELYILSTAHCFDGIDYAPNRRRIRAGATYRNSGGILIPFEREYNHPDYRVAARYDADITVVRLVSPLQLTPVTSQTLIPPQGFVVPDNSPVVYAGWGATSFLGADSSVLLFTQVYTVNNDLCRQRYLEARWPGVVTPNMICAGLLNIGGRDACHGDSGGPLYFGDITVGLVSWGEECALANFPGVSTAVSSYTNWIVQMASQ